MFVPGAHARVHISGVGNANQKRAGKARPKVVRRRVGVREILRMPCLMPTICVVFIGLLVLAGGAGMCVLGYTPDAVPDLGNHDLVLDNHNHHHNGFTTTTAAASTKTRNDSTTTTVKDARYYATKGLSYAGPVLMACGFFAIIVSCVLYCEIVDRYAMLMPSKPQTRLKRQDLLEMILGEFKKSYFRGIEVPIRKARPGQAARKSSGGSGGGRGGDRQMETLLKALSISTPVLLMSPDLAPTWRFSHYPYSYRGSHPHHRHLALKPRHPKLKQLGGSGSSGGGGSGGGGGHEPWLKTSSLPNICDPELRRHSHLQSRGGLEPHQDVGPGAGGGPGSGPGSVSGSGRARRLKRFGRPSRSMENRISWSLPQTLSRSSTGVDNPAYLHEQDRKKSVSMCVHATGYSSRRPPGTPRFIKASQLQPRMRLQQQQQQQIQKQQQQQQQQKQQQHAQKQQQQQQRRLTKQHSSRDSDEASGRRRCGSDEPRRQRPKLVRTKGAHKSFDSSAGGESFSTLVLPTEPPPFPLPAHFIHTQQQQQQQQQQQNTPPLQQDSLFLQAASPRSAKLLRARCKSEDVRDKKKADIMLLKDLFRSVDVQDPPLPPPSLVTQMSSSSMPCTITGTGYGAASGTASGAAAAAYFFDPLAGQQWQDVVVTVHPHHHDKAGSGGDGGGSGSGEVDKGKKGQKDRASVSSVAVSPWSTEGTNITSSSNNATLMNMNVSDARPVQPASTTLVDTGDDQRYELPLLSGVAGTNRQWEAERRKKISSDSRHDEKAHSLDAAKDSRAPRLEVRKTEIHRAHSFNAPLAQDSKPARSKLFSMGRSSQEKDKDKEGSNFLRVFLPNQGRSRPRSWDGDKSQSLDTPGLGEVSKASGKLAVPRIERASSFDPMASPTRRVAKETKQVTSYSSEHVRPVSPYPCRLLFESEGRAAGRSRSDEIRQRTPTLPTSPLTLPEPLQPQRVHVSPDRNTGDVSPAPQHHHHHHRHHHHHHHQQQLPPQQPQLLTVPTVQMPSHPRRSPSPRRVSPSHADHHHHHQHRGHISPQRETTPSELAPCEIPSLRPPSPRPPKTLHQPSDQSGSSALRRTTPDRQLSEQRHVEAQASDQPQQHKHPQQRGDSVQQQRRPTIVHQASVHLSLDSFPDTSVSITSSTLSSTDNTTSSNVPLLPASPPSASVGTGGDAAGDGSGEAADTTHAVRRLKYTQSRSVAVEESSPEDEDTENTPLIHSPAAGHGSGHSPKS